MTARQPAGPPQPRPTGPVGRDPRARPHDTPEHPRAANRRQGGAFLGGAGGRLLPASVPMRWFGLAVVAHLLAWGVLGASAAGWPAWHGGLRWPLAALHLATLGTLLASAIGASLQLLPVATRQAVRWPRAAGLLWWAYVPGLALLVAGMGLARPAWLAAGALPVLAVLVAWGVLTALNLRGARGMPGVVLHGWAALAALGLLVASAAALVALWNGQLPWSRDTLRALHGLAGPFGVMGMLVLGLSAILLPMFALAAVPDDARQLRSGNLATLALALAIAAALAPAGGLLLRGAALACGAAALALHVQAMRRVLAQGMRGDLGRSGRLIRLSWAMAAATLLLGLGGVVDESRGGDGDPFGRLAATCAVAGWLGSLLFGILQRILPFLASMHAALAKRRAPTPAALTAPLPLAVHEAGHLAALALLVPAVGWRSPGWLLAASVAGGVGAAGFGVFFATMLLRLHRAAPRT